MIKLTRRRDAASLHKSFTGARLQGKLKLLCEARIRDGSAIEFKKQLGDWKKTKSTLRIESSYKCAYCEQLAAGVTHADVEHFRPKSQYWWLALCIDNYVYACEICNQTFKGDNFPIQGSKLRAPRLPAALPATENALNALLGKICPDPASTDDAELRTKWFKEDADLPNPYMEDPEPYFAWKAYPVTKEVELVLPKRASPRAKLAVASSIKYLGLNREVLKRARWMVYSSLALHIKGWYKEQDPEYLAQIRYMCGDDAPFAAMSRHFARLSKVPI